MININNWLEIFLSALDDTFNDRIWFVGLQGSYAHNEATQESDIDIVVILDKLSSEDISLYNRMLDSLPHRELICGFVSGKNELLNWEPSDLFQFYYDTKPIRGSLDKLTELITPETINRAIKIGACNIYHGCVHNMLHEKSNEILAGLYKSASFVIQAICFMQTGKYCSCKEDMLQLISPEDKVVIDTHTKLKKGTYIDFSSASDTLFLWSANIIENYK